MLDIHKLFEQFIKHARMEGKSLITVKNYRANFQLLLAFKPDLTVKDLNERTMGDFFVYLDERERQVGKKRIVRKLKKSSIQTIIGKLKVFFEWLLERNYITTNPFVNVSSPSVSYTDIKAFNQKEIDKIFLVLNRDIVWENELIRKRNIALGMFLLYTGVRKNELLHVKSKDLDLEKATLEVQGETSKSGTNRTVIFSKDLIPYINDYQKERADYQCEYLWVSSMRDARFTEHGLKHLVNKLKVYTELHFYIHRFRHTFAVNLYKQTRDILLVQSMLGHSTLRMTLSYLRSLKHDSYIQQLIRLSGKEYV